MKRSGKTAIVLFIFAAGLLLNCTRLRIYRFDDSLRKTAASATAIDRQYGVSIAEEDGVLVFKYSAYWIICNPKDHTITGNIPQEHNVFNVLTELKSKRNTGYKTDAALSYTAYSTLTSDGILVVWGEDGPIALLDCFGYKKEEKSIPGDPCILAHIYTLLLFGLR